MSESLDRHRRFVNPGWAELVEAIGLPVEGLQALGSWILTPDGAGMLDMIAGFGAATLGHNPPALIAALHAALDRGSPNQAPIGIVAEQGLLAERLIGLAGHGLAKVHFGSSGAEAVDSALKLAAARTGRAAFLSVRGGFHGLSIAATSLAPADPWRAPFPDLWLPAEPVAAGDLAALERLLASRRFAALVLEIVPGSDAGAGWPAEAVAGAAALCAAAGSLLVVDEVQTGLGRTGRWFAFHAAGEGFRPDMVLVSKGLTGGIVPLSAVLMTDAVFEATFGGPGRARIHGSTFAGNRLAMACGLAVIDQVEQLGLIGRVVEAGARLRLGLDRILGGGRHAGTGLIATCALDAAPEAAADRCLALLRRGVLASVAPHSPCHLRLTPPLTIGDDEIDLFLEVLAEVV